jgi:hypothetical protein
MENNNNDTVVVYSFNSHTPFIDRVYEVTAWLMAKGHSNVYQVVDRTSGGVMEYTEFTTNKVTTNIRDFQPINSDQHVIKPDQYGDLWEAQKRELDEWGVELPKEPYYIGFFSGDQWDLKFLMFAPRNSAFNERRVIAVKFPSVEDAITFKLSV